MTALDSKKIFDKDGNLAQNVQKVIFDKEATQKIMKASNNTVNSRYQTISSSNEK